MYQKPSSAQRQKKLPTTSHNHSKSLACIDKITVFKTIKESAEGINQLLTEGGNNLTKTEKKIKRLGETIEIIKNKRVNVLDN